MDVTVICNLVAWFVVRIVDVISVMFGSGHGAGGSLKSVDWSVQEDKDP